MPLGPYPGDGVPRTPTASAMYFIDTQLRRLFTALGSSSASGLPSAPAVGDLIYWDGTSFVSLPVGTAVKYLGNRNGIPAYEQVSLADGVTGNLPVAHLNSATGATSSTFWRGDGTWAIPAAGTGSVVVVTRTFTAAEINTLNSVPISIVAAAGTNTVLLPVRVMFWATRTATVFSADPLFRLRWAGSTIDLIGAVSFFLTSAGAGEAFRDTTTSAFNPGYGGFDPRNVALQVSTSADSTGGTGASIRIGVAYAPVAF